MTRSNRKKKLRGLIRRTGDRVTLAMLIAAGLSLFAIVLCLELIGPPPRWRIDALWVRGHTRAVRLIVAAGVIAIAASIIPFLLSGRGREGRRAIIAVLWIGLIVACVALYWDRIPILYNVVVRYML